MRREPVKESRATGRGAELAPRLADALRYHQAGQLEDAERLYREILAADPQHGDALHLLGLVNQQSGRFDEAAELITRAVAARGDVPLYHLSLGVTRRLQGRLEEAEVAHRRALALNPEYGEAHNGLGLLLQAQGRLDEAVASYRRAIATNPADAEAHYNVGLALQQQGARDEAILAYGRAVGLAPQWAEAHNNLGVLLQNQGRLEEAEECYRRALAARSDYADAHNNLGTIYQLQGKLVEAAGQFRAALAVDPSYARAHGNLGGLLRKQGNPESAIDSFRRAIALDDRQADIYNNLGTILQDQMRLDEAERCYRQVLVIDPAHAEAHYNLGTVLQQMRRPAEAVACYEAALALVPNHVKALNNLGTIFQEAGDPEAALAYYRRGLVLEPDRADSLHNVATALLDTGKLDEARFHFEQAIARDPRNALYHFNLADMKRFEPGDPQLAALVALAADKSFHEESQARFHFALGKAYADLGDRDLSFRQLVEANALKRRHLTYDEPRALKLFDRIAHVFTRELLAEKAQLGSPSPVPIFIVAMPRSGTTLVEQILASHPRVFGGGELEEFGRALARLHLPSGTPPAYPELVPNLGGGELRSLGEAYVSAVTQRAPEAERITDKLPANFLYLGLIHLALPNARLIHLRRDPVDTCLSCFSKLFKEGQEFSYDLAELGRYYKAYARLMEHWRGVLPSGAMLEIDYEELVADLETHARRLVEYCGLAWDPACLAFHSTDRPVRTASAAQVRQPIYGTSVGRAAAYRDLLQPLIDALG